jgi:long-chain acyl-CoA synthetase
LHIAFVGGDFVAPSLLERFNQRMKDAGSSARLYEGYGLTEVVTVCCVNNNQHYRQGSVGKLLPNIAIKVVDVNTKEDLPFHELGELYVRGETMMNGYRFMSEGGTQPFVRDKDGLTWIATGDYGSIDEDNFVYFRQRIKRIVKVSGINVFPSEIEALVRSLDNVYECAAIGIEDEKLGHSIKLFVVLQRSYMGEKPDEKIRELIKAHCGIYATPRIIEYRDSLPKTLLGKVDAKLLS